MVRIKLLALIMLIGLIFSCSSCANRRHVIVTGYQGLGITIETLGKSLKVLCDEGKIKQNECQNIGKIYNNVVNAYKDLGDMYAKVIESGSDEDVKNYKAHLEVIMEGLKKLRGYLNVEDN